MKVIAHVKAGQSVIQQTVHTTKTDEQFRRALTDARHLAFSLTRGGRVTMLLHVDDVAMWQIVDE